MQMYLGDRVRFFSRRKNDWVRGVLADVTLEQTSGRSEPFITVEFANGELVRFRARDEDLKRKQFSVRFSDYARTAA